ncbi:hypothetical protein [Weissella viridescens]|uniref:hypothetical protein n=1 Tax=Weissella viridescens TaxID=1629 RepID=UPI003AF283C3
MAFQNYNKEIGFWVGQSDTPSADPSLGSTEVPLPGEPGQGIMYVFDETIQMWRSYDEQQWSKHLDEHTVTIPNSDEEFKAVMTGQLTSLSKTTIMLSSQLALANKAVALLESRLSALEKNSNQGMEE